MRAVVGPIAAALLLVGCTRLGPELSGEARAAAWQRLMPGEAEAAFDARAARLSSVRPDAQPPVGEGYREPAFPPDLPFDPTKWETGAPGPSVAVPGAPRQGILRLATTRFPNTVRTEGPNSNLAELSDIQDLVYEYLLEYDASLERYVPRLATHWQTDPDRRTFRFRLNPRARWSDGRPVTSDDVKATFEHYTNPDRKDPFYARFYGDLVESVTILDRLTVEIKAREPRWRSQLTIAAGTRIYPAAFIRMDGQTYLKEWNWRLPPGTGPYELRREDIEKPRRITIRRREDYWDKDNPALAGQYNFEAIRWIKITEDELIYQKFKAGELDLISISRAQRWVEELDQEPMIQMGWVQKRRIFNLDPNGFGGYCFNMRKAPFDRLRVRLAFAQLLNREHLMEKLFFKQYEYTDSYFPGSPYARPDAQRVPFDPEAARKLLAEDGWDRRDGEGYLTNAQGERFPVLEFEYAVPSFERIHQVYQQDLWQEAGIKLVLKLVDFPALQKKVSERNFLLHFQTWTGSQFPNPEWAWHAKFADQPASGNYCGYKDPRFDALSDAYQLEFDPTQRRRMLQEMDAIVFDAHPYALAWHGPYFRVLYWDRLGQPPEYADRFARDLRNIYAYWWLDGARAARTEANHKAGRPNHPDRPMNQYDDIEQRYWLEHDKPMPRDAR